MYENLVGNVKEFLMISSKIYTPEEILTEKLVNPEFLKINVAER